MSLSAQKKPDAAGQAAPAPSTGEHRAATRYTPLIRTAKITGEAGEFLCVVSDISATGVSVRLFHPLPRDGALKLWRGILAKAPPDASWRPLVEQAVAALSTPEAAP